MASRYQEKRDFALTPEPAPLEPRTGHQWPLLFVVQKHAARRLHYDFRLEVDGVLKSWSIPNGPSLNPKTKRLVVMVEDHPLDYASFEGVIPQRQYGAGQVIVWDSGTYAPEEDGQLFFHSRALAEQMIREGLDKGKLAFVMRGRKLKGSWALVRMKRGDSNWLLIKHDDDFADVEKDVLEQDASVLSGLSIEDLKAGRLTTHNTLPVDLLSGAYQSPFPESLEPMLAEQNKGSFPGAGWLFEPKLDGYRTLAFLRDGKVMLQSRRGISVTERYPHAASELINQPAAELVLDGEIVALNEKGRICFQCLQQYLESMTGSKSQLGELPIYYVFDILFLDGYDLRQMPLYQRKELLARVLRQSASVRLVDYFEGDARTIYEAAINKGLEGIMAKKQDSPYQSGERSSYWLKIKSVQSDEFVIGGFSQGTGNRTSTFGALLLGYFNEKGDLVYVGHVGSGFDDKMLKELRQSLDRIKTGKCPFIEMPPLNAPTTWVRPELVAEVRFAERTQEGYLRIPVFLRLREDKKATEVRFVEGEPTEQVEAQSEVSSIIDQIRKSARSTTLDVQGQRISLTNLDKELWPATDGQAALTKRDFIIYLAQVSPYLLSHLHERPLSLKRYPDGVGGEAFFQKHWESQLPDFVETVKLTEHKMVGEYLLCKNLPTLLWLGQLADIESHTWFSRVQVGDNASDKPPIRAGRETADSAADYPDFIIFDIDPYIYSGKEAKGGEPELNPQGFGATCEVALKLKSVLDSLSLPAFVKTSGRTGLHVYVPILRQFQYPAVHAAAKTIARIMEQAYPEKVTTEWAVEKRTGKVFLDYNQNVRGKTLISVYSPRATPEATVSTPLQWDEVGKVYPTNFTITTVLPRLVKMGDLWSGILETKSDLKRALQIRDE